jgi:hypothetical protein
MIYKYSLDDPRTNARHYMFAPYGGAPFVDGYFAAREAALSRLPPERRVVPGSEEPISLPELGSPIEVLSLVRACHRNRVTSAAICEAWTQFLRRKIEIHHRLRRSYDAAGRMSSDEDAGIDAYCLSAILFMDRYDGAPKDPHRLGWLNATLKANDVSIHLLNSDPVACVSPFAREAIEREVTAVRHEWIAAEIVLDRA